MKKICSFILSLFFLIGMSNVCSLNSYGLKDTTPFEQELDPKLQEESELLYSRITQFLELHKDASPEEFEEICRKYIADNSTPPVLLDKEEFARQSAGKMILYRGVSEESYADEFKKGNIYIGESWPNNRGSGIYTTPSKEYANKFAKNGPIIKMFLSEDKDVKVIEFFTLNDLKINMLFNHSEEFEQTIRKVEELMLTSSVALQDYEAGIMKSCTTMEEIDKALKRMKQEDPVYKELMQKRVKSEENLVKEDKKFALLHNSGLLAKLLGYNLLHAGRFNGSTEEYLVLDAGILTVCK